MARDIMWDSANIIESKETKNSLFESKSYQGRVSLKKWKYKNLSVNETIFHTTNQMRYLTFSFSSPKDNESDKPHLIERIYGFCNDELNYFRETLSDNTLTDISFRSGIPTRYYNQKTGQNTPIDATKLDAESKKLAPKIQDTLIPFLTQILEQYIPQNNPETIIPDFKEMTQALQSKADKENTSPYIASSGYSNLILSLFNQKRVAFRSMD